MIIIALVVLGVLYSTSTRRVHETTEVDDEVPDID
jgi:hypothetical protein